MDKLEFVTSVLDTNGFKYNEKIKKAKDYGFDSRMQEGLFEQIVDALYENCLYLLNVGQSKSLLTLIASLSEEAVGLTEKGLPEKKQLKSRDKINGLLSESSRYKYSPKEEEKTAKRKVQNDLRALQLFINRVLSTPEDHTPAAIAAAKEIKEAVLTLSAKAEQIHDHSSKKACEYAAKIEALLQEACDDYSSGIISTSSIPTLDKVGRLLDEWLSQVKADYGFTGKVKFGTTPDGELSIAKLESDSAYLTSLNELRANIEIQMKKLESLADSGNIEAHEKSLNLQKERLKTLVIAAKAHPTTSAMDAIHKQQEQVKKEEVLLQKAKDRLFKIQAGPRYRTLLNIVDLINDIAAYADNKVALSYIQKYFEVKEAYAFVNQTTADPNKIETLLTKWREVKTIIDTAERQADNNLDLMDSLLSAAFTEEEIAVTEEKGKISQDNLDELAALSAELGLDEKDGEEKEEPAEEEKNEETPMDVIA